MATEQPTDADALMHSALATYLPQDEPPIGLRVDDIMRLGRRRSRTRRAIPIAAAAVTVLAIGLPWTINSSTPAPQRQPAGTTSTPQTAGESSVGRSATSPPPSASGTIAGPPTHNGGQPDGAGGTTGSSSTSTGSPPPAPFRLPAGHSQEDAATRLTKHGVENRLPAGRVTSYFGSRSDIATPGPRYAYGMHMLWQEGDRYGYLFILHRTKGEYPATDFWLPVEPCAEPADRLPAYRCTAYPAPAGDVATSFEVDTNGYRMRGVVWDKKDPAGGADIRVTGVLYLPAPGALTPFSLMDDAPRLTRIPLAQADIAQLIGMPE